MKQKPVTAVLPVGAADVLPPYAALENEAQTRIMNLFMSCGYKRVAPSVLEFEDTLFPECQNDLALQTVRIPDAVSGKMMGVRADMTLQAARIALTRLKNVPRPLRLAYTGTVLRNHVGKGLSSRRQILQTGAELTGVDSACADAEIILLANEALKTVLNRPLSIDLTLPTLFKALCRAYAVSDEDARPVQEALNQKDFQTVKTLVDASGGKARKNLSVFERLFEACGRIEHVTTVLNDIDLPSEARAECRRLAQVADILKREAPDLSVTADVLENRGFEYHCGLSFSFFDKTSGAELARGGRYLAQATAADSEPATGVTLMTDTVVALLPAAKEAEKVYVPKGTPFAQAMRLRSEGYVLVFGLGDAPEEEARQQNCTLKYVNHTIEKI